MHGSNTASESCWSDVCWRWRPDTPRLIFDLICEPRKTFELVALPESRRELKCCECFSKRSSLNPARDTPTTQFRRLFFTSLRGHKEQVIKTQSHLHEIKSEHMLLRKRSHKAYTGEREPGDCGSGLKLCFAWFFTRCLMKFKKTFTVFTCRKTMLSGAICIKMWCWRVLINCPYVRRWEWVQMHPNFSSTKLEMKIKEG